MKHLFGRLSSLKSRFSRNEEAGKALNNSLWYLFDKVVRLVAAVLVSLQITNLLGPEQYGTMSKGLAFAGLFTPLVTMGLASVMVRELVRRPEERNVLLGTAFVLRLAGTLVATLLALGIGWSVYGSQPIVLAVIALQMLTLALQSSEIIDYFYQSQQKAQYSVYAKNTAFLTFVAVKVVLLVLKAPMIAFVWVLAGEAALTLFLQAAVFGRQWIQPRLWRLDRALALSLFQECWPQMLSYMVVLVYMRTDAVMIGWLVNDAEVGLYSAAVRISELWYFIPYALYESVGRPLVQSYEENPQQFYRRQQKVVDLMLWIGLAFALGTQVFGRWAIELLYKPAFAPSADILLLHIWTGLALCLNTAGLHYHSILRLQKLSFYKNLIGALTNVGLNLWLIPIYGGLGAAMATLPSYLLSAWGANLLFPETRPLFWMAVKALDPRRWWAYATGKERIV